MTRLLEGTTNRVAITSYLRIKYSFKAGKQFLIIQRHCWGRRLTINRCEAVNIWCQSVRMSGCRVLHYTKHFLQNEFSAPEIWNNLIIIIAATLASQCPDLAQFPSRSTFIQNNGGKKWKKGKNLSFGEYLYHNQQTHTELSVLTIPRKWDNILWRNWWMEDTFYQEHFLFSFEVFLLRSIILLFCAAKQFLSNL